MTTAVPFVRKIRTNVRAGEDRPTEIELGRLTLLVGSNGRGKSRIINALELALTGTADDVWLRSMTKEADLVVLMPHGENRLYATAEFDGLGNLPPGSQTKATAHYEFRLVNGKVKRGAADGEEPHQLPAWFTSIGSWALPVREVYSAFTSGPDKARVFFLPFMAPGGSAEDIKRRLAVEFHNPAENGGKLPNSTSEILAFIALAQERVKEERGRENAANSLSKDMRANIHGPDPSSDALQGARRLVLAYQRIVERMAADGAVGEAERQRQVAEAETHRLRQVQASQEQQRGVELENLDKQLAEMQAWITWAQTGGLDQTAPDPGPLSATTDLWKRILETGRAHAHVLTEATAQGLDRCHGCGGNITPQSQAGVIPYLDAKLAELGTQIEGWSQKKAFREQCLAQFRETVARFEPLTGQRKALATMPLGVRLPEGSPGYTPPAPAPEVEIVPLPPGAAVPSNMEEARRMLTTAEEAERAALSHRERWDAIRQAENRASEAARLKVWWGEYEAALRRVVGELLDDGASRFAERAQKYMPSQWRLHIQLRDGEREVFRLGLVKDGIVDMAPSGAQLASAAIAMALACLETLPGGPPPFALLTLPEERDWDAKTLAEVMRALSECPYQVVLTSTTEPAARGTKGWTILNLNPPKAPRAKGDKGDVTEGAEGSAPLIPEVIMPGGQDHPVPQPATAGPQNPFVAMQQHRS